MRANDRQTNNRICRLCPNLTQLPSMMFCAECVRIRWNHLYTAFEQAEALAKKLPRSLELLTRAYPADLANSTNSTPNEPELCLKFYPASYPHQQLRFFRTHMETAFDDASWGFKRLGYAAPDFNQQVVKLLQQGENHLGQTQAQASTQPRPQLMQT